MNKKLSLILISIFVLVFTIAGLGLVVKGKPGQYQYDYNTEVGGPFESSNTTSRYILTESIVNRNTYYLDEKQAFFAAPDVVYHNNKFFSIFTPGVSFLAIPFYKLGAQYGLPQLFSFFTTLVFAVMNVFLVARLAAKFGANKFLSYALGLTFLFSTNALGYALTLTQHHYSVSVILLAVLNALIEKRTIWNNIAFGLLFTFGILLDVPNAFMMVPLVFYILASHFEFTKKETILKIFVNPVGFWIIAAMIPLLAFFGYYNIHTSGSPTLIGQNLGQTDYFYSEEKRQQELLEDLNDVAELVETPFNTRKQLSGFYILLVSDERGIIYYNTVVLIGLLGLIIAYRNRQRLVGIVSSVILVNVVLYSAFGDAWGGWSFGPRYLIPSVALLVAAIGSISLVKDRKWLYSLIGLFIVTLIYSTYINVLGALTTNAIPPKVEAQALANPLPYTYKYNFDLLSQNRSSSLVFNSLLKNSMSLGQLHLVMTIVSILIIGSLFGLGVLRKEKKS